MENAKNKFRSWQGWVEKTDQRVYVQPGTKRDSLEEAVNDAKRLIRGKSWVEEEGKIAHISDSSILIRSRSSAG